MKKTEVQEKFLKFISEGLDQITIEGLKVGCFLFTVLIKNDRTRSLVLYDELLYGWCVDEDDYIKTLVAPTGLTEYQIDRGIVDLIKHGIFNITNDKKLKQLMVEVRE